MLVHVLVRFVATLVPFSTFFLYFLFLPLFSLFYLIYIVKRPFPSMKCVDLDARVVTFVILFIYTLSSPVTGLPERPPGDS